MPLIATDYFKWPEVYAIPNQEASTVADAPLTNFLCHFGVLRELHSDHGWNFKSHLLQVVLQHLGMSKTYHPSSFPVAWHGGTNVKMIEEHLRKVILTQQRGWDERLPIFCWHADHTLMRPQA
jgi:hypothetical protein